jgi:hypothetical protein
LPSLHFGMIRQMRENSCNIGRYQKNPITYEKHQRYKFPLLVISVTWAHRPNFVWSWLFHSQARLHTTVFTHWMEIRARHALLEDKSNCILRRRIYWQVCHNFLSKTILQLPERWEHRNPIKESDSCCRCDRSMPTFSILRHKYRRNRHHREDKSDVHPKNLEHANWSTCC